MKIARLIYDAKEELKEVSDTPYLEAELLLAFLLHKSKEYVIANLDNALSPELSEKFFSLVELRKERYPLNYITGEKEFMGLKFFVNPSVLIPRPETEILVEKALEISHGSPVKIIDIGTGSGCILLSFLHYNSLAQGVGIDISEKAIEVARKNAEALGLSERSVFFVSDFRYFDSGERFDMVLSNPPYVRTDELKNVPFEPALALNGGQSGYELYPELIEKAYGLLKDNGTAIVEIDYRFQKEIKELFLKNKYREISFIKDLSNRVRFVKGVK